MIKQHKTTKLWLSHQDADFHLSWTISQGGDQKPDDHSAVIVTAMFLCGERRHFKRDIHLWHNPPIKVCVMEWSDWNHSITRGAWQPAGSLKKDTRRTLRQWEKSFSGLVRLGSLVWIPGSMWGRNQALLISTPIPWLKWSVVVWWQHLSVKMISSSMTREAHHSRGHKECGNVQRHPRWKPASKCNWTQTGAKVHLLSGRVKVHSQDIKGVASGWFYESTWMTQSESRLESDWTGKWWDTDSSLQRGVSWKTGCVAWVTVTVTKGASTKY